MFLVIGRDLQHSSDWKVYILSFLSYGSPPELLQLVSYLPESEGEKVFPVSVPNNRIYRSAWLVNIIFLGI